MWNLVSVRLKIVFVPVHDRCTVSVERTTSSEIILDAPDGTQITCVMWTLMSVYLETVLESVQDRCTVSAKHTIGSEIILN
jgi:hypothetical protein